MSLSEEDRTRLNSILEENAKKGGDNGPPVGHAHPTVKEVQEVVERFADQGRRRFKAKHIVAQLDRPGQAVGAALHSLRQRGVIAPENPDGPTPYQWVILE